MFKAQSEHQVDAQMNESVLREAFVSTPVTFIQTRFHVHAAVMMSSRSSDIRA